MLYSEFLEKTNCLDNQFNMNIYEKLNDLYMITGISKQDLFEFGKKLVNNGTEEDLKIIQRKKLEEQLTVVQNGIEHFKKRAIFYRDVVHDNEESSRLFQFINTLKHREEAILWSLSKLKFYKGGGNNVEAR